MSKTTFTQCTLKKEVLGCFSITQVSYIQSEFAVVGKILKMKTEDGKWDEGWEVMGVGTATEFPPDYRKAIRGHRERTGDSLPKNAH